MVVRSADAQVAKLETLSDAAQHKPGWSLGVTEEFMERLDGYGLLVKTYKLPVNGAPKMTEAGELYRSLEKKQASMVAGSITDGALAEPNWKVLRDDQGVFIPDAAALAVRAAALEEHPGLRQALGFLLGKFSAQAVRKLNHEVEFEHRPVPAVAKEFLSGVGL
jgi:glycine betaine/choline ABC-type transport system substrate-binding protein